MAVLVAGVGAPITRDSYVGCLSRSGYALPFVGTR